MDIRRMEGADLPAVAALEREIFSVPWSEESFRAYIGRPEAVFLVAAENGGIIGYGGILLAADQGDITNVAVRGDARRRGVGRRIVKALLESAEARGAREIFLEVRAGNRPAIALYESFGFVPAGTRKNYYQHPAEDAVLMRRKEGENGS